MVQFSHEDYAGDNKDLIDPNKFKEIAVEILERKKNSSLSQSGVVPAQVLYQLFIIKNNIIYFIRRRNDDQILKKLNYFFFFKQSY